PQVEEEAAVPAPAVFGAADRPISSWNRLLRPGGCTPAYPAARGETSAEIDLPAGIEASTPWHQERWDRVGPFAREHRLLPLWHQCSTGLCSSTPVRPKPGNRER